MSRMIPLWVLAGCCAGVVAADEPVKPRAVQFAFNADLIQIDNATLRELNIQSPAEGFFPLDPIPAFFLRVVVDRNDNKTNVSARPKASFPDGQQIALSNGQFDDAASRRIRREGAWTDARPYAIGLLPQAKSTSTFALTVTHGPTERKKILGPTLIADGASNLILLEKEGSTWRALLLTPRMIAEE